MLFLTHEGPKCFARISKIMARQTRNVYPWAFVFILFMFKTPGGNGNMIQFPPCARAVNNYTVHGNFWPLLKDRTHPYN